MCCFCNRNSQLIRADCNNCFDNDRNKRDDFCMDKMQGPCSGCMQNGWGKDCSNRCPRSKIEWDCKCQPKHQRNEFFDGCVRVKFDGFIKFC